MRQVYNMSKIYHIPADRPLFQLSSPLNVKKHVVWMKKMVSPFSPALFVLRYLLLMA